MTAEPELIVGAALEIPVRDGFDEFVAEVRRRGERLVVLSSGFRQLIEPMLAHAGHGDIELVSNELEFSPSGSRITWRQIPVCQTCGEECKRHDVARLREEFSASHVTFVGDGFSDRCGAEAADRILALEGGALELDLTSRGVVHETWGDFHDVRNLIWS